MASHVDNRLRVELHDAQTNKIADIAEVITRNWQPVSYEPRPRPSRLELMGFEIAEQQQIANIALGLGQSPIALGELIMHCRPIPTFILPFVFWRDFDWRKAWALTAVLVLVAVVGA